MVVRSRLEGEMDKLALQLTSSIEHDVNIWYYDVLVDIAHVLGLMKQNYLLEEEAAKIVAGLMEIAYEIERSGKLPEKGEDIHEAIEAKLTEIVGEAGMKMHTARSRNDEVATCLRMFARNALLTLAETILELRRVLITKAEEHIDTIIPGFTHLQYAQPTKLSHHLIAFHDMFERSFERCMQAFERVNLCPLGSAAFASTSFKLDREYVARLLGFDGIVENSEDAVASRDFLIESMFIACDSLLTLSRLAEEVVLWSSEFGFVELPDEYASSSSIMPQKKNPDVAEIVRAKAGRVTGNLTAAMAIYKAMPLAYNRDFQEMNPLLYESLKDACLSFKVMADMVAKLAFKTEVMEKKAGEGFASATYVAEMLAKKGIPFRKAHKIVGRLSAEVLDGVSACSSAEGLYEKLVEIMKEMSEGPIPDREEFENWLDVKNVVESRAVVGGTSAEEVRRMLEERKRKLEEDSKRIEERREKVKESIELMKKRAIELIEKL